MFIEYRTINNLPWRITIYGKGDRMLNDYHRLCMPHRDFRWYLIAEVYPRLPDGSFDDKRFWTEFPRFEGIAYCKDTDDPTPWPGFLRATEFLCTWFEKEVA